jgi:hypothetical protein
MSVAAANTLTARFASTVGEGSTVLSGAGIYPLLALLGEHAAGPARDELLAVAGSPVRFDLDDSPTTRLALGVWSHRDLPLTERWRATVPDSVRGLLTGDPDVDQPALDGWADKQTGGLIPTMPIRVDRETLMVLASALSVTTGWAAPFDEGWCRPGTGPWQGRTLAGLHHTTYDLGILQIAGTSAGPVTLLTVRGADDVDVVLVLGEPDRPAGRVLPAAITALGDGWDRPGIDGPGVRTDTVAAFNDRPELTVATVGFTVTGEHDLLRHAPLFGLSTATRRDTGHFPGISPAPLAVSQARQSATATFGALGFKAAAVTAIGMRAGSAPRPMDKRKQVVRVDFDRPFGFLAVHRPTGLVLVAGWVTDPDPHPSTTGQAG